MSILQMQMPFTVPIAPNPQQLSFSSFLSSSEKSIFLGSQFSHLSFHTQPLRRKITTIRMGGGPRTYPGGVSKWQWKRMQEKKAKQLLKARLARERQIYEMRKRAELKAAASELERPWEVVERAPNLFSVRADEQLKVLADRFQRPGGFDMWTYRDGPQLLRADDEVPSARYFPKGVVHSVKPYARIDEALDGGIGNSGQRGLQGNGHKSNIKSIGDGKVSGRQLRGKSESSRPVVESKGVNGKSRRRRRRSREKFGHPGGSNSGLDRKQSGQNYEGDDNNKGDVYEMGLQQDGSYGLEAKSEQNLNSAAKEEIAKLRFF